MTSGKVLWILATVSGMALPAAGQCMAPTVHDYAMLEPRGAQAAADPPTQVTVRWKAPQSPERVAGYRVYFGGEEVARTDELTYTQEGLQPGVTYLFRVAAFSADGKLGRASKIAEATPPAAEGDVLPLTSVGIFERGRDVLVTWWTKDPATSRVEYGTTTKLGEVKEGPATVIVHTVRLTDLKPDVVYYLRLASTDAQGRTGRSMITRVRTGRDRHSILPHLDEARRRRLVLPRDFHYRGAFRPPASARGGRSRWGYGGGALTYCPKGPGSLFGVGHGWKALVSAISIPAPAMPAARKPSKLPVARTLQGFADITAGLKARHRFDDAGGLAWLEKQPGQDADKIYWSFYIYYAVQGMGTIDHPAFGCSNLDLSAPDARGLWHVGPYGKAAFHPKKNADYMFDIPRKWADRHTGGLYLVAGKGHGCGSAGVSHGPSMVAFGPYKDGRPPADRAALTAKILVMYPPRGDYFPYWSPGDAWTGGAWLTSGVTSAVLISGRRALGEPFYGKGRPGDWGGSKGYHATPYEAQLLLYDPADLEEVLAAKKRPREVLPYAVFRPGEHLRGRHGAIGAVAFDRRRSLLYVFEPLGERPLIHVFAITDTDRGRAGRPARQ
ncbi:MAG: fibronectin type III domain-containing protein [Planctomycetota bacterium]